MSFAAQHRPCSSSGNGSSTSPACRYSFVLDRIPQRAPSPPASRLAVFLPILCHSHYRREDSALPKKDNQHHQSQPQQRTFWHCSRRHCPSPAERLTSSIVNVHFRLGAKLLDLTTPIKRPQFRTAAPRFARSQERLFAKSWLTHLPPKFVLGSTFPARQTRT